VERCALGRSLEFQPDGGMVAASFKTAHRLINAGGHQPGQERPACRRRLNFDPPCRLNFDPGMEAGIVDVGCA
jgi:hypothetical protein